MKSNANSESRPRALPSAFKATAWPPSICCRSGLLRYQRPIHWMSPLLADRVAKVFFAAWRATEQCKPLKASHSNLMTAHQAIQCPRYPARPHLLGSAHRHNAGRSNVHGGGLNLLSWVVAGDDIARVAAISVETTEPRGIIAVSLAVTPS